MARFMWLTFFFSQVTSPALFSRNNLPIFSTLVEPTIHFFRIHPSGSVCLNELGGTRNLKDDIYTVGILLILIPRNSEMVQAVSQEIMVDMRTVSFSIVQTDFHSKEVGLYPGILNVTFRNSLTGFYVEVKQFIYKFKFFLIPSVVGNLPDLTD